MGADSTPHIKNADAGLLADLGDAVKAARRGHRSDTQALVNLLDQGGLLVPLAKPVEGVELGEPTRPEGDVSLSPHLLADDSGDEVMPVFTDADFLSSFADYAGWRTEADDLHYCTLPLRAVFDLALQLIDAHSVTALVLNPGTELELVLVRHELASLGQGEPIPLVGYVERIAGEERDKTLISVLDHEPSPDLIASIERCVQKMDGITGYRLEQTFNRERDLEPHPTLTLLATDLGALDLAALDQVLAQELEGRLPEPGYIDVLFESTGHESTASPSSELEPD